MDIKSNIRQLRTQANLSQDELAKAIGVSDKTVSSWENGTRTPRMGAIQKLADYFGVKKTDIIGDDNNDRSKAQLPADAYPYQPTHRIPILGRISAGLPLYAEEHLEGYTFTQFNSGAEYFALRVHGDSMDALHILDNNILIVRRQDIVENGEIAVVMVGDSEATVKRFYRKQNIVTLMPQSTNPVHQPQIYDLCETPIRVIGKVVQNQISY